MSKASRHSEKAGDTPPLKLVAGHEGEEADRNKGPEANSRLEESYEPPLWDAPSCDRPSIPVGSASTGEHMLYLLLGLNPAEIRFVLPNLAELESQNIESQSQF